MAHPWKDLLVWRKSHLLVLEVYKLSENFPSKEQFGLTQQLRRSIVSVASNIVEGKSKNTDKEFLAFLHTSRGSLEEARYQLLLCKDLGYLSEKSFVAVEELSGEVSYLLNQLIKSIK